jgi:glycosyltransferase involved in cell wall biosynthesis
MLFSILIANYNNSTLLPRAIESVLSQSYTNWEIIIVDDRSADDFVNAIYKYLTDKRIQFYRNPVHRGCGYTKRRCAELAGGDVFAFLDSDDALHPEALEIMRNSHLKNPDCSLIHSTHFVCNDKLEPVRIADYPRALPDNTPYLLVSDGRVHHFATFKSIAYRRSDGVSPELQKAVDQDLYYKLEEQGKILFIDKPLYYYRIHQASISNEGNEAEANIWHYKVIEAACRRRISELQSRGDVNSPLIKLYRKKLLKTQILHAFRGHRWAAFSGFLIQYGVEGGLPHMLTYIRKLATEGRSRFRKSFVETYQIRP